MKSIGVLVGSMILLIFCFSLIAAICAEPQPVPADFMIDFRKDFAKAVQAPVHMTHQKHSKDYKAACNACHHVYKDGKNVWKEGDKVEKCIACHPTDRKAAADKFGPNKMLDLKNSFHKNCQGCHKEAVKAGKKAPIQCAQCHVKK
jgi:hypothetical protein